MPGRVNSREDWTSRARQASQGCMDQGRLTEIAHRLSALAAMKMEDIIPLALALPRQRGKAVDATLLLRDEAQSISALLEAAAFLIAQADEFRAAAPVRLKTGLR